MRLSPIDDNRDSELNTWGDWFSRYHPQMQLLRLVAVFGGLQQSFKSWLQLAFAVAGGCGMLTSHKSPVNALIFNRSTSRTNLLKPLETATVCIHKLPEPQPLRLNHRNNVLCLQSRKLTKVKLACRFVFFFSNFMCKLAFKPNENDRIVSDTNSSFCHHRTLFEFKTCIRYSGTPRSPPSDDLTSLSSNPEKGADVADLWSKSKLGLNAILRGEIDRKGYGFITPNDGGAWSIFVHQSSIRSIFSSRENDETKLESSGGEGSCYWCGCFCSSVIIANRNQSFFLVFRNFVCQRKLRSTSPNADPTNVSPKPESTLANCPMNLNDVSTLFSHMHVIYVKLLTPLSIPYQDSQYFFY
ncbi:hypothetical protein YC2023_065753 [Brassica napus]